MEEMSIAIDTELLEQMKEVCAKEGVTVEEACQQFAAAVVRDKNILIEMLEDAEDLRIAEEAHEEYIRSGKKSRPIEELWKELDLEESPLIWEQIKEKQ